MHDDTTVLTFGNRRPMLDVVETTDNLPGQALKSRGVCEAGLEMPCSEAWRTVMVVAGGMSEAVW